MQFFFSFRNISTHCCHLRITIVRNKAQRRLLNCRSPLTTSPFVTDVTTILKGCISGIGAGGANQETSPDELTSKNDSATSEGSWQSTTSPAKPMTHDRLYYFLPYWDDKPCLHVRSIWPDYRRRMYNSNIIGKIIDKLASY